MSTRSIQAEGFVLRSVEYGERDLVVGLYGRGLGKFSAIAKNARGSERRFGGGLQPMRLLQLSVTAKPNRDLDRLDEIDVRDAYPGIEKSFDKITVGSFATELFRSATVERNPHSGLFELLVDFYERLGDAASDPAVLEVLLRHFQLRLFEHAGEAPALESCLRCGRPTGALEKVYALRTGEGVVCDGCARTGESVGFLYPGTLDLLRYYRAPHGDVPDAISGLDRRRQARRFLEAAQRRILEGAELKSREMLDSVLERSNNRE